MEKILANKTVSLTELRDPAKVFANAGSSPVAVLNRSHVVGYLVPKAAVDKIEFKVASDEDFQRVLKESIEEDQPILDYLKDK